MRPPMQYNRRTHAVCPYRFAAFRMIPMVLREIRCEQAKNRGGIIAPSCRDASNASANAIAIECVRKCNAIQRTHAVCPYRLVAFRTIPMVLREITDSIPQTSGWGCFVKRKKPPLREAFCFLQAGRLRIWFIQRRRVPS